MKRFILSLAVLWLASCGPHPKTGHPEVAASWTGYNHVNKVFLLNTSFDPEVLENDSTFKEVLFALYDYVHAEYGHLQANTAVYFYNGNAPASIPVPEYRANTLGSMELFMDSAPKPYATFLISSGEVDMHPGYWWLY